jgi:hypothetical protein
VISRVPAVKSSRLKSTVAVCSAVAGCALAAASAASASTLAVDSSGALRFTAAWGETNAVAATDLNTGGPMVVTDTGSTIRVGRGCVQVTPHEGQCPVHAGQDLLIDLADRDDSARAYTIEQLRRVRITGGWGDDTIQDLPQFGAEVSGGSGNDTILVRPNFGGDVDVHGDSGNDSITAMSATGVVNGDTGDDDITLFTVIDPLDGASAAYGGSGDDSITADGQTAISLIDGGSDDDAITTTDLASASVMNGGSGADTITAVPGHAEQINGGSGRDVVNGGGGGDTIDCGFGLDRYVVYAGDTATSCEIALTPEPALGALR